MSQQVLDDTKQRILDAAGPTFAERGFREATVRDICQAAGVNLAAVNYHFGDKQRLYIESVKLAHRHLMQQAPLPEWPAGTPAEVKLHGFIYAFMCRVLSHGDNWQRRLMMREIGQPSAACEEFVREYIQPQFRVLLGILDELLPAGTPDVVRHRTAFSIVGQCLHYLIARPIVRWLIPADEFAQYTPDQLAAHVWRFSLTSLKAAAAGDQPTTPPTPKLPPAVSDDDGASAKPRSTQSSGDQA
ncbi:MAG: CerR family C-terminal domain-containing protein [Pirellulales bacterium]